MDRSVHIARNLKMVMMAGIRVSQKTQEETLHRSVHNFVVDLPHWLRNCPGAPCGEYVNGRDFAVPDSCADLVETEDSAIGALAQDLQSITDQHKMFGRDFLAGPPIDDGGRSYAGHAGCFGRTTEGVYDIVN